MLPILDALYSSRAVLAALARQHGDQASSWPPHIVKQLRERHNVLVNRIERHICSLSNAEYHPIGALRSQGPITSAMPHGTCKLLHSQRGTTVDLLPSCLALIPLLVRKLLLTNSQARRLMAAETAGQATLEIFA